MVRKTTTWAVLTYGLFILSLGCWGYYSKGSIISLYSGIGFGAILVLSSVAMFGQKRWGKVIALIATLALTIVFAIRSSHTGAPLSSGIAVLSGGMLLFLLTRFTKWRK